MISEKSLQEVLDSAQVEDVVSDFVNLKRRGSNLVGLCPFHNEKTPSFSVSPSKNIYKCFGCGEAGGPVQFLKRHENYSFIEAVRYLADKYGIELEETERSEEYEEEQREKDSLYILYDYAAGWYRDQLAKNREGQSIGLSYFKERGLLEKTMETFQLGYAPADGMSFTRKAKEEGFSEELLQKAGLINRYRKDFFRERVIFTIHNISGKPIAFAGRVLGNKSGPKYVNSPETEIYHKSRILYGISQAKNDIRREDNCFLVEGYTDVITLHQNGIRNVLASSGTALTDGQIRLIKRFTDNVTILYDADPAGIRAASRGIDLMLGQDMNVRIALLPEGEDPDSFMKSQGVNRFRSFIAENAVDFVLFKTNQYLEEAQNDPVKKSALVKDLVRTLAQISDTVKRSVYVQQCAGMFGLSESVIINELNAAIRKKLWEKRREQMREERRGPKETVEEGPVYPAEQAPIAQTGEYQERDIIRILLLASDQLMDTDSGITIGEYIMESLEDSIALFEHPVYKRMIDLYQTGHEKGEIPLAESFLHHEDEAISKTAIDMMTDPYQYSHNWEERWDIILTTQKMPEENYKKDAYMALLRLKMTKIDLVIKQNSQLIKEAGSPEDREKHILVHQELLRNRNQMARELKTIVL